MQLFVKAKVITNEFTYITDVTISSITASGITVAASISADKSSKIFYGPSKTTMLEIADMTFAANKITVTLTGLSPATTYYFYIGNTAASEAGHLVYIHLKLWQHKNGRITKFES